MFSFGQPSSSSETATSQESSGQGQPSSTPASDRPSSAHGGIVGGGLSQRTNVNIGGNAIVSSFANAAEGNGLSLGGGSVVQDNDALPFQQQQQQQQVRSFEGVDNTEEPTHGQSLDNQEEWRHAGFSEDDGAIHPTAGMMASFRCLRSRLHGNFKIVEEYCKSQAFQQYVESEGLEGAVFKLNTIQSEELKKKFWQANSQNATLAIVFHGTSPSNIEAIKQNGLDPTRRRGQAYGPGEYFAYKPSVSSSYCKGGKQMMVFLVVVPTAIDTVKRQPLEYVVVENNAHQWPLGSVEFSSVDRTTLTRSTMMQKKLNDLHNLAKKAHHLKMELSNKALVIQAIVQENWDFAERKWENFYCGNVAKDATPLRHSCKQEISHFAHLKMDGEVLKILFPQIPPPPKGEMEFKMTVEEQEKEAAKARKALMDGAGYNEITSHPYGILKGVVDGKAFVKGDWGSAICDELKPADGDIVVEGRRGLDTFASTNLDFMLRSKGVTFLL